MRTFSKFACVVLLLGLGISVGFGWGTVTHVYFANHLGVKFGTLNQNEIYGATLNDVFGYDFTYRGFVADYALHASKDVLWGLYLSAQSAPAKAAFYGMITHNNISTPANIWGADYYAHGVYPLPGDPYTGGWVINQGMILVGNPKIADYINGLVGPFAPYFLPVVGHNLIETAVDILVRDREDWLVGERLVLAARNRSDEVPQVLAGVLAGAGLYGADTVMMAEAAWRAQMKDYGKLFLLPDNLLIKQIAAQTAGVAEAFLGQVIGMDPVPTVDPDKIVEFIKIAIEQVRHQYHAELMATLCHLEKNSRNWPPVAGPSFAFWKDGATEEQFAEVNAMNETPTEFTLGQNFPNPFNPTTNIAYAVPLSGRVTLKVYNSIGQLITTLVDEDRAAGRYTATWDAKGLASGTYFYRMQAGGTVLSNKMVLMK